MKKCCILLIIFLGGVLYAQKNQKNNTLKTLSDKACLCIDSIRTTNKTKENLSKEISDCIDKQVILYQALKKTDESILNKNNKVEVNINPDSQDYKEAYEELENYLMDSCTILREKIAASDFHSEYSMSKDPKALAHYYKGIEEAERGNLENAIEQYKLAVKTDPKFAFAWDNLGITYRRVERYDDAISAYKNSLKADPKGKMPLQNIPIVYIYKKEYQKAINAFKEFDKTYPGDPEVYYGIGQIYFQHLEDYEKSLDYMCKAYIIYTRTKNPYRTDAESIILSIYKKMKEQNKTELFNTTLKRNGITPN